MSPRETLADAAQDRGPRILADLRSYSANYFSDLGVIYATHSINSWGMTEQLEILTLSPVTGQTSPSSERERETVDAWPEGALHGDTK